MQLEHTDVESACDDVRLVAATFYLSLCHLRCFLAHLLNLRVDNEAAILHFNNKGIKFKNLVCKLSYQRTLEWVLTYMFGHNKDIAQRLSMQS